MEKIDGESLLAILVAHARDPEGSTLMNEDLSSLVRTPFSPVFPVYADSFIFLFADKSIPTRSTHPTVEGDRSNMVL